MRAVGRSRSMLHTLLRPGRRPVLLPTGLALVDPGGEMRRHDLAKPQKRLVFLAAVFIAIFRCV
jgi:hypothetical protein